MTALIRRLVTPNRRILSFDGGGARILASTIAANLLEEEIRRKDAQAHLADYFDLIAGTSSGSVLAGLLNIPSKQKVPRKPQKLFAKKLPPAPSISLYSAREVCQFMLKFTPKVFSKSKGTGLFSEKYDSLHAEEAFAQGMGDIKLSDMPVPCLFPSYDMHNEEAVFFCSHDYFTGEALKAWGINPPTGAIKPDLPLKTACRASAAAPVYFTPVQPYGEDGPILVDGGIFSNNPVLSAYAEIRSRWVGEPGARHLKVVSIGTAAPGGKMTGGGYLTGWRFGLTLLESVFTIGTQVAHFQLQRIFSQASRRNYKRIQLQLDKPNSLDQCDQASLAEYARSALNFPGEDEDLLDLVLSSEPLMPYAKPALAAQVSRIATGLARRGRTAGSQWHVGAKMTMDEPYHKGLQPTRGEKHGL